MTEVEAEVLVSDGHGAYSEVADELGPAQQICRNHTQRNVDELADSLTRQLQNKEPPLEETNLTPEQLLEDLEQLKQLIRKRSSDGEEQLAKMYDRYHAGLQTPGIDQKCGLPDDFAGGL